MTNQKMECFWRSWWQSKNIPERSEERVEKNKE